MYLIMPIFPLITYLINFNTLCVDALYIYA